MKKKTGLIIGIVAICIVLIGTGAFAFLYFATDIFKSNEQLFWKYASNSEQFVKMLSNDNKTTQKEWKETHSYTAKGDLSMAVTKETGTKEVKVRNSEKHNQNTGRTYADMTLYNGEAELLKASYIHNGDIYALYCKEIYEPYYIGFRNSDLKQFAEKLGIQNVETLGLPDAISFDMSNIEEQITPEEEKYLSDTYSKIVLNSIPKERYSRTEKESMTINNQNYQAVGYSLQLSNEEIKQMVIAILTKMKDNEQTIEIISKLLPDNDVADLQSAIEQIIEAMQETVIDEVTYTITVYNINKQLTRIQIKNHENMTIILDVDNGQSKKQTAVLQVNCVSIGDVASEETDIARSDIDMKITLEKQILDNMTIYTTNISNAQNGYEMIVSTTLGNVIEDKIENNSKITIFDNDATIETSYYKTIEIASEEVDIQELTNSSAVIINNYPIEQLVNFFDGISNKVATVIPDKISQLNIQMTNAQEPIYYTEGIMASILAMMNANGLSQPISVMGAVTTVAINQMMTTATNGVEDSMGNATNSLEEQEKQMFNQQFEMYKGEDINGTLVKTLLSSVTTSNTSYAEENEKIIKVRVSGSKIKKPDSWNEQGESDKTRLEQLKNNINVGNQYSVVIEYNTKGFAEIITISEK